MQITLFLINRTTQNDESYSFKHLYHDGQLLMINVVPFVILII